MALGYLFLLFAVMSVLAILGTVLLFWVKHKNGVDVLLVLMTAYSMTIAYMNATAQPANYVSTQILAWIVGLVAVAGTGIRYYAKKQLLISRIFVAVSVIGGIYLLYFG